MSVRYRKLNQNSDSEEDEVDSCSVDSAEDFIPAQFEKPPTQVPWKAVIYAVVLFFLGTLLLTIGCLIVTGHIESKYGDRFWPLILLGSLMFLPGSYHTYFAYKAFRGDPDWNFDEFPDF